MRFVDMQVLLVMLITACLITHILFELTNMVIAKTLLCISRNLCDIRGVGQLNLDQFCLAMHLVQQKLAGVDPPQTLPPNMVPPSLRGPGLVSSDLAVILLSFFIVSHDLDEGRTVLIVCQGFIQDQIIAIHTFWWIRGCELLGQFANMK